MTLEIVCIKLLILLVRGITSECLNRLGDSFLVSVKNVLSSCGAMASVQGLKEGRKLCCAVVGGRHPSMERPGESSREQRLEYCFLFFVF